MSSVDAVSIVELVDQIRQVQAFLAQHPELRPVALKLLDLSPTMNGGPRRKRTVSPERRRQMSIAAKKRWALLKKQGKNKLS